MPQHPSRIGAQSSVEDRVETYLDQAGGTALNGATLAPLVGALCISIIDLADAIRESGDGIADPLKTVGVELGQVSIAIQGRE